jgi:hypothetical protein
MRTAIEVGKDGTRTIFHREGNEASAHPFDQPCEDCPTGSPTGVPIPLNVNPHPLNPVGGDKVYVRYEQEHGGFLGFEVVYADRSKGTELYSTPETLPRRFRNRVKLAGRYCVSPGCSNLLERGNLCRTHRGTRKAGMASSAAGQRG